MTKYKKNKEPVVHEHKPSRPQPGLTDVLRLTDEDTWLPDDGEPGLAFVGVDVNGRHYAVSNLDCRCKYADATCPTHKARMYNVGRFNRSRPVGFEFNRFSDR
jgi:hypothetical protein